MGVSSLPALHLPWPLPILRRQGGRKGITQVREQQPQVPEE